MWATRVWCYVLCPGFFVCASYRFVIIATENTEDSEVMNRNVPPLRPWPTVR
jgi:hypothetical protein